MKGLGNETALAIGSPPTPARPDGLRRIRVDAETNEHEAALERLGIPPDAGEVVVGDATLGQRDLAAKVPAGGGDSLLVVTDDQEALKVDIGSHSRPKTPPDPSRPLPLRTPPCRHRRRSGWRRRRTRGTGGWKCGRCGPVRSRPPGRGGRD